MKLANGSQCAKILPDKNLQLKYFLNTEVIRQFITAKVWLPYICQHFAPTIFSPHSVQIYIEIMRLISALLSNF